ncbi:hypothetical protein CYMTET_4893 [Cymbomonas tetramitiformis]|uniref:Uncharacterized protein n=1 Tax=Cymbomonas tetramitiformis TaxID=36881 RepID=A0AAE0H0F5_9CHLO|nr:hypothetical protein CYMTET_4893 [Cymbomonas tetramitiformis]
MATADFMAVKTLTPLEDQTCKQADNAKVRGLVVVVRRDICPELDAELIALNATIAEEAREVNAAQKTSRKDHRKEVEVDHEEAWRQKECGREGVAYDIGKSPSADGELGVDATNSRDAGVNASNIDDGVDRVTVEDEFFFIADAVKGECEQNWWFVICSLMLLVRHYVELGVTLIGLIIGSDGCGVQFKSKLPFMGMSYFFSLTGKLLHWFYGGSGRFKGRHDTAGGGLDAFIEKEILKGDGDAEGCGRRIKNAADVVAAVNSGYGTPLGMANKRVVQRRVAFLITPEMILQAQREGVNAGGESVHCTRALHDLVPVAPGRVMRRPLSCFTCEACCEGKWLDCTNTELCGSYEEAMIQAATDRDAAHLRRHARQERATTAMFVGDTLGEPLDFTDQRAVAHLEVGNNVAVAIPGDDESPPWTMKVTKLIYKLDKEHTSPEFIDANGQPYTFPSGSEVLHGFWYQQKSEASYRYELWDDEWATAGRFSKNFRKNSKAFLEHTLFPHLVFPASWVFHSKFDMMQESHGRRAARQHAGDRVFIMSEEDDEEIADAWVAASEQ